MKERGIQYVKTLFYKENVRPHFPLGKNGEIGDNDACDWNLSSPRVPIFGTEMHVLTEHHVLVFLIQLFLLLFLARGLGVWFRKWGQPATTAEILVGVILGPTLLGRYVPEGFHFLFPDDPLQHSMLETAAWIGVLFLLLDTGLEIDFSIAWRQRGRALMIAVTGIVTPMLFSFAAVWFLPESYLVDPERHLLFALFMATVMSITAMAVTARTFQDLGLLKSDLGFLTISALAVNDIIGWSLFSVIMGLFLQSGHDGPPVMLMVLGTVGFATLALTLGRSASSKLFDYLKEKKYPEPGTSLTVTCLMGLLFGIITAEIGMHALFGFFLAGVMAGEAKSLSEETRRVISQMVHSVFIPLFFTNVGLKIDVAAHFDLGLALLITSVSVGGKFIGAYLGEVLAGVPRSDRSLIAIAHTPGGMMEIVVALLALENGMITRPVFVAIVFSAVMSCVFMGPWAAWALRRRPGAGVRDVFRPDFVRLDIPAPNRTAAIATAAELLAGSRGPSVVAEIVNQTITREEEYGTALGHGLALPHLRMQNLKKPRLAFLRLREGVDWDAPDGQPVRLVFYLLSPEGADTLHLKIIAAIAKAVSNEELRHQLETSESPEELDVKLEQLFLDQNSNSS